MQFITTIHVLTTELGNGALHCSIRTEIFPYNPSLPPQGFWQRLASTLLCTGGRGITLSNKIRQNVWIFFHDCSLTIVREIPCTLKLAKKNITKTTVLKLTFPKSTSNRKCHFYLTKKVINNKFEPSMNYIYLPAHCVEVKQFCNTFSKHQTVT